VLISDINTDFIRTYTYRRHTGKRSLYLGVRLFSSSAPTLFNYNSEQRTDNNTPAGPSTAMVSFAA